MGVSHQSPPPLPNPPPLPELHLEKILRRTCLVSTFLFVYHLRRCPNTRKAWGYMANSITSLGLVSTAVGTGLVSSVLSANPSYSEGIVNPMMNAICSTIMKGGWEMKGNGGGERSMTHRMEWIISQIRDEIKRNKRYYVAIVMFCGMGSLSRMRRRRIACVPNRQQMTR